MCAGRRRVFRVPEVWLLIHLIMCLLYHFTKAAREIRLRAEISHRLMAAHPQ